MKKLGLRRVTLLFVIAVIILAACEIPNYKGTLWYYMDRTADLAMLDTERRIYELRAPAPSNLSGEAQVAFQVPVDGTYYLRRDVDTQFGFIYIYEYADETRTTRVSQYGGYVNPENNNLDDAEFELEAGRYYQFESVQSGPSYPAIVDFFAFEFWHESRWW